MSIAHSQSTVAIVSSQNNSTAQGFGVKLNAVGCNAGTLLWTGWTNVTGQRNIVYDVALVDANSDETSLDVRCETSTTDTTAVDAGFDLPVITSTASTGVNSLTLNTWSWVAVGGGAPGTSKFELYIENIPAPFIECLFTCQGAKAAADTVTARARGINP